MDVNGRRILGIARGVKCERERGRRGWWEVRALAATRMRIQRVRTRRGGISRNAFADLARAVPVGADTIAREYRKSVPHVHAVDGPHEGVVQGGF